MKKRKFYLTGVLLLFMAMVVGCGVLQEPEAASNPIEAVPLEVETSVPPATEVPPTEIPQTELPTDAEELTPTEEPTAETPMEEDTGSSGQELAIFQIVPGESQVRFELGEDLRGTRNIVVGVTDQVAGELAVDFSDLSTTQVGTLQINARTLTTDNDFRNRAIKNEILNSNEYEFITFMPTAVNGLPNNVTLGESVSFTIVGDLTIRDMTNEVTLDVEATAVSDTELSGIANAVVLRSNYELNIPTVPNVASVDDEVNLYIDFIARKVSEAAGITPANDSTRDNAVTLRLAENEELGGFLTDAAGMTLYTFANDVPGTSNCYDRCATAWPPLLVEEDEEITAVDSLPGELGTTERADGTVQVTYNGWPLYYWVNDEAPGDTTGHNVGNVWAVAYPTTLVFLGGNDELGKFLVGPEGLTLYRFNRDEPNVSNCSDQCAVNWPPLLVEEGQTPTGNAGVVGDLSTIERADGTLQVTYQKMPLYYWVDDVVSGDATGQGVNDVWFVVPPYTVRTNQNDELGDFLAGANGLTLYRFDNDTENASNCADQCAVNWPPLLVQENEVPVGGFGVTGELGVITRDDGTYQVTYDGQPLYFWLDDEAPGDTTGQGVNDLWFVVTP